jgi:hypothetical protein
MALAVKSVQDEVVPALERRLDIQSSVRTVARAKISRVWRIAWVIMIRWNWNVAICSRKGLIRVLHT